MVPVQGPGQSNPLLLTAGNLAGPAVLEFLHLYKPQHLLDPGFNLRFGLALHFQAKTNVLTNGHMRKQRIALEDRVDRPLERGKRRNVLPIQQNLPVSRKIKTCNQTQQSGFSAA